MIRKFLKITAWVLLSLFLITGALIYSIRLPAFQTWITARAAQYLSSQLGVKVSVGNVYILFFSRVQLKDIYIEDQEQDTLLYAGSLTSEVELFSPKNNKIYLSGIDLENATVKVIKYPGKPGLNFKFLLDYFASTDTTPSKPFDFNPGEIRLKNVSFAYIDKRYNDPADGIDFEDIRLDKLQATLSNFIVQNDTLLADLDHLSFTEKSGFRLEYMESNIRFTPNEVEFQNLLINTPNSNIQCEYKMSFENAEDFDDYINKVRMTSVFEESTLSFLDLRYFAPELKGLEHEILIKGKVRGTVAQLRGKQLEIRFGAQSVFRGDASLTGLPDINETFFDLVVDELITSKSDIETIPTWPFTEGEMIELPDNFGLLGNVKINGKFTGFLSDFVAYGNASTALGYVSSDINLKIDEATEKSSYSGKLSALGFQIGKFTNSPDILGKVSFKAGIEGTGLNLNNVNARLEGQVSELELKGYTYSSIKVNGRLRRKQFEGNLNVDEPNFAIDFSGGIDLRSKIPVYDFTTTIHRARLANLNLLKRDESANLALAADINIRGRDLDELTGFIHAHDIVYSELEDTIKIAKMQFTSERGNDVQTANFRSDLLDFDLKGRYKRSHLFDAINQVIAMYFPVFRDQKQKSVPPADLAIDIRTYDLNDVTRIFLPELSVSNNSTFHGELNNQTGLFKATLISDSIRYGNTHIISANLSANSLDRNSMIDIDCRANSIEFNDTLEFNNIRITASSGSKDANFQVSATSLDTIKNKVLLTGHADYFPNLIAFRLEPSQIMLNGNNLNISENARFGITDTNVTVEGFRLYSDSSFVEVNGIVSDRKEDKLVITIHKFKTETLNPILGMYDFNMGGEATGTGSLNGILENPGITADIEITNLNVYGDTLGNASFDFLYDTENSIITVDAFADRGGVKNIEVTGNMIIGEKEDSLDFTVQLKKTNLAAFAGYAKGLVSDVRGKASGTLKLEGTLRKPLLRGQIRLQQTSFLVDFMQTRYNFSDVVYFNQRTIKFDHIKVNDVNGNQAEVYGVIRHNHLSDFVFDLEISAKNFQALNTLPKDNELFYGTAYATGKVTITGTPELTNLYMALRSEKNTLINIPLSNPEEVSKSSFINFINTDSTKEAIDTETETKVTGISMTMEVDATPDAEIRLIFDQKIGDVIKGRGSGNLTMTIDPLGDFRMYGNYQVVSGDYLFTLQNLLNKKFIINTGGTIRWSGDPYDADMALDGVYKLKASLYDLFQDTSYKKRVPVEVILKLSDKLFNPTVRFDIRVPDTDPTTQTLINRYINTEQELNKQTMSLLVLNRFSKSAEVEYGGPSSSSGVSANVSEILSQQLSVWASQISDAFDVGVNYRAADQFSQEELEVALSTNLFNDRVTIDGAVNMSENNQNTSNLVGDFNVEVKVSKDGRFRFKAFNKSVENTITNNYASQYTQGIGVFYRQEFDNFSDLFKRYRSQPKKEEEAPVPAPIPEAQPEQ